MYKHVSLLFVLLNTFIHSYQIKYLHETFITPFFSRKRCSISTNRGQFKGVLKFKYHSFSHISIKEKGENQNESNIFDKSYVYHTPVLVDEVIEYLRNDSFRNGGQRRHHTDGDDPKGIPPLYDGNKTVGGKIKEKEKEISVVRGKMENCETLNEGKSQRGAFARPSASASSVLAPDLSSPAPDSSFPTPNSSSPTPDLSSPTPDLSSPTPDSALPTSSPSSSVPFLPMEVNSTEYYIDATLGGGGHTMEILKNFPQTCKVIAVDKDIESIYYNKHKLQKYLDQEKLTIIHGDYRNIMNLLYRHSLPLFGKYSGILIDLGMSTHQLKCRKRGFSYKYNDLLDMCMDKYTTAEYAKMCGFTDPYDSKGPSISRDSNQSDNSKDSNNMNEFSTTNASKKQIGRILNKYNYTQLKFIMYTYGQEKKASKIAKKIIQWRKSNGMITTTYHLRDIILSTCKQNYKANQKVLSRVFQSFRIYINDELNALKEFLLSCYKLLKPRKRLVVISYHSLEYRCVEAFIQGEKKLWVKVNENVITPSEMELKVNNSARSAKMSVFEKI
ncbi:S-adenosyl-methyltransferase mraW [Plasmodium gonderi]|uniref:S-adenosyl-methyltransferase mraW n=1 Tax=Plasmodium gonderi TaxID=77519 RepID=A0A1Y1JSG3_PLAGO|nr:S-adenosyl-methyltransferase mraW [Plasmodium gonderi]GAW83742.1 S-adenosyl-methyltransferase mraW [Plasmodium gonderi]